MVHFKAAQPWFHPYIYFPDRNSKSIGADREFTDEVYLRGQCVSGSLQRQLLRTTKYLQLYYARAFLGSQLTLTLCRRIPGRTQTVLGDMMRPLWTSAFIVVVLLLLTLHRFRGKVLRFSTEDLGVRGSHWTSSGPRLPGWSCPALRCANIDVKSTSFGL
jgi:hypothetical protein